MPYTDIMPVTAQPQHNKWRKLTYHPLPLPTIQAREQLVAFVAKTDLPSNDWLSGFTKREAPAAIPKSRWLNDSQVTKVSGAIRLTPKSWRKARRMVLSDIPDSRFWSGIRSFGALPASTAGP
jgi:hypothetical protein